MRGIFSDSLACSDEVLLVVDNYRDQDGTRWLIATDNAERTVDLRGNTTARVVGGEALGLRQGAGSS